MINGGIFGPKLSGKSTLAKHLSKSYWDKKHIRSLVFDPHEDYDWGNQAWVTGNSDEFWGTIWRIRNCLVMVDEAAITINRDKELVPTFTAMRHNCHKLIVIGHSGVDLLPSMRQNLDTLYLFRQPKKAAIVWSETFADERLLQCQYLNKYEFLHTTLFGEPVKLRLSI